MTSSISSSQNVNSKKNSWRIDNANLSDRDQLTPNINKNTALDFRKKDEAIIDLSNSKQSKDGLPSPKNDTMASNSFKNEENSGKKINIINNQDINTERKG